jgi:ornithine cyclodeaminase/alanine dehydrogenase-like protein (mu-crystallin family)
MKPIWLLFAASLTISRVAAAGPNTFTTTVGNMIVLKRDEIANLLTLDECIDAVESAFKLYGQSKSGVLGIHGVDGGFHIKAAILPSGRSYFAAKVNGNFPDNQTRHGLPTIQGVIVLCDAGDGRPLAVMDSIEITILRTGAATAVAARHLARRDSKVAAICGCGNQGRVQLRALKRVLPLEEAFVWDIDDARSARYAGELSRELGMRISAVANPSEAITESDVCVTCTPARAPFVKRSDLRPGVFLAAVGADSADKQELEMDILTSSKLVVDILDQCAAIGELHHALQAGARAHAELGQVVAGARAGRISDEEIIVFDSTGTALQDVAAAAIVYERASQEKIGIEIALA